MMLHRRRLIHSKLTLKDSATKKKQVVVAMSGLPSPGDGSYMAIPAQVQIYKESFDPSAKTRKSFRNPRMCISLDNAQVSVIGALSQLSGRKLSRGAGPSCSFRITTKEGSCFEFVAENESERLVWVTVLEFLAMFPYSSVPEVPKCNPVFRNDLEPSDYNADSVWPVYILPEEVGSRCSLIGSNILALQGRVAGSRPGKLDIYSPTDNQEPIISWDHDKIRRTGKLGHLLFIEIGRRCKGGPGLVWMYTGNCDKKVYELRDTLRRFLFEEVRRNSEPSSTGEMPAASKSSPTPGTTSPAPPSAQQLHPPPLPPIRRSHSISNPSTRSVRPSPHHPHNYHLLEPTPS